MDMLRDRIAGALYGVAVGDALGGPLEFMSAAEINRQHGWVSTMLGGGWLGLRPGETTDDTAMTLAVAEGIMERPEAPIQDIGRRFIRWAESGPKDIGGACAWSIRTAKRIGGGAPTTEDWENAAAAYQLQVAAPVEGNGALMRTIYPALYYPNHSKAEYWAMKIARMTHAGLRSTEACILYSRMVNLITASKSQQQASREFLKEHCEAVKEYRDAASGKEVAPAGGGWVVDSMRIAVGSTANTSSFREAVTMAVNLGGDADTNGAITGGLAGALYGFQTIPKEWVSALSTHDRERLDAAVDAAMESRMTK